MEALLALGIGLVMSFVGSMPIAGPVAVLVLERGLRKRSREALLIAVGAALPEGIYAFLAFWGIGTALEAYPVVLPLSRILTGIVLVCVGVHFVRRAFVSAHADGRPPRTRSALLLGFTITLLNPTILASWAVVATAMHSAGLVSAALPNAAVFASGVTAGAITWFATMLLIMRRFGRSLELATVGRIVRVLGWIIIVAGAALVGRQLVATWG